MPRDAGVVALELEGNPEAPSIARAAVSEALGRQTPVLREVAVLLTDEVVTNALVHTRGRIELRICEDPSGVRIEVTDMSVEPPLVRTPRPTSERGRGMLIVSSLASSWGVVTRPRGKCVWFRLDADKVPRSGPRGEGAP